MPDTADSPYEQAARTLDAVLDDHAELRDVVAQIAQAGDAAILNGLLHRLQDLLAAHFAREEADPNMQRMVALLAAPATASSNTLIDEHRELLTALEKLIALLQTEGEAAFTAVGRDVDAFLERLGRHDTRETELLADNIDAASDSNSPLVLRSDALVANLRRTAVDVAIPAEQAVLLEIVADRFGVHASTQKLLREINHRYAGWAEALEDLHRRATSDFAYYIADERAAEAVDVFLRLYDKIVERSSEPSLRESAVRRWFHYMEKVVGESGERLAQLQPALERALARLESILADDSRLASVASTRLRSLAERLLVTAPDPDDPLVERTLGLLASVLCQVYRQWLALPDPATWWSEQVGAAATWSEPLARITHAQLRQSLDRIEDLIRAEAPLAQSAAELLELPDAARIERGYLDATAADDWESGECGPVSLQRIHWLIRILSIEALSAVYPQALAEIHHACHDALAGADSRSFLLLIREIFAALRRSQLSSSPAALALISKIGVEVVGSGDPDRADSVIDELLDWEFPSPGFSGFSEQWQVRVNPAHLLAIRAFLAVIRENPELSHRLIAALVVHLKIGGIFVADTDLFQRDVSQLMNAKIAPVYHPIKHLLKLFPVYFNEIGAEGELREVSSRIDEIRGRRDLLCHFLRKQCHVESNPRLIGLIDAMGRFWADGDPTPLRVFLPPSVYDHLDIASEEYAELHAAFSELLGTEGVATLATLPPAELERRLAEVRGARDVDRDKVRLLIRLRQLISQKYELNHDDLLERLAATRGVDEAEVEELHRALDEQRHEDALEQLLDVLERLKATIVCGERTEGFEDIYRKRHIAAGIPSMYGRYREEKFEAMGLSLRIESLAGVLFEKMIATDDRQYVTRDTLQRTARWLRLLLRATRVDGCRGRGIATGIAMLEQALCADGISVGQYINLFQIISRGLEQLVRIRFIDVYQETVDRSVRCSLAQRSPAPDENELPENELREQSLKTSEGFLRDLMAQSFGLQPLDRLVTATLRCLVQARESFDRDTLEQLLGFEADRCCVPIETREGRLDGAVFLGNKGFQIKVLARNGLPVPQGFILTTEFFRRHAAVQSCAPLRQAIRNRIRGEIARLERETGCGFGSPRRPLLLSVRSGAAVSMPGILDTFLNVGITEEITEGLAAHSGSRWGAWDAYRRFLQHWAMGNGIDRDCFDALMRQFKSDIGIAKKAEFPPEAMRELALRYRRFVEDQGVELSEEPLDQVERCVELVMRSWDSDKARVYRAELQIAEEWGTAVVIQAMVYGNLSDRSGTGVVLTCDPNSPEREVVLHGDFVVQSQGDDVVGGLVETLPISEKQRLGASAGGTLSLEKDFPRIYHALLAHAKTLVINQEMFPQEIEFTFESDDPADLYILQVRDSVMAAVSSVAVFCADETLEQARLVTGIGAGGGALCGRVAHTSEDIERLRRRYPDDSIILLRPDTVPDDIPLILKTDGMVTALGGATSHAALVAQQLGRTCVVGCRELSVDDEMRQSTLGGSTLCSGDLISINGIDGSVYIGKHAVTTVRRHQLA